MGDVSLYSSFCSCRFILILSALPFSSDSDEEKDDKEDADDSMAVDEEQPSKPSDPNDLSAFNLDTYDDEPSAETSAF